MNSEQKLKSSLPDVFEGDKKEDNCKFNGEVQKCVADNKNQQKSVEVTSNTSTSLAFQPTQNEIINNNITINFPSSNKNQSATKNEVDKGESSIAETTAAIEDQVDTMNSNRAANTPTEGKL